MAALANLVPKLFGMELAYASGIPKKLLKNIFIWHEIIFLFSKRFCLQWPITSVESRKRKGKEMKLTVAQYRTILNGLMSRESQLEELLALNSVYITAEDRSRWQAELDGIPSLIDTMAMASVQESIG